MSFFEKAYRRRSLATWDAKWQQLSVAARHAFLHTVKLPEKDPIHLPVPPSAPGTAFAPQVLEELDAAGFAKIEPARSAATSDRVVRRQRSERLRLARPHPAADAPSRPHRPTEFAKYVEEVFYSIDLLQAIVGVLRRAGFEGYLSTSMSC